MKKDNPNHKEEVPFKAGEKSDFQVFNKELQTQNPNEDFMLLKEKLIYYKTKGNIEKLEENLDPLFINLKLEYEHDNFLEKGLDLCIISDVSESIYPWRIFYKKAIYLMLMDVENLFFSAENITTEHLNKIRLSLITYSDYKKSVSKLDFVTYSNLGEFIDNLDKIDLPIKEEIKKRNVFEAYKTANELSWNEESIRIIVHFCPDPQYGLKYTSAPKELPNDYDPYPEGIEDQDDEEILDNLSNILQEGKFNMVKFNKRCEKFGKLIQEKLSGDINSPKVIPLA